MAQSVEPQIADLANGWLKQYKLKYYIEQGIFTLSGVEKMTGINQKQLWSYLHGTKPRGAQSQRMETGFRRLKEDLDSVFMSA